MRFTKMHGAGNDYVYVNCFDEPLPGRPGRTGPARLRPAFRHRRRRADPDLPLATWPTPGCGCSTPTAPRPRCAATASAAWPSTSTTTASAASETLRIETGRGVLTLDLEVADGRVRPRPRRHGRADPRTGRASPPRCPAIPRLPGSPAADVELNVAGETLRVTCVSMGNPHCVTFVDELTDRLGAAGRAAGRDRSAFPQARQRRVRPGALAGGGAHAGLGARLRRDAGLRHRRLRRVRGRRADRPHRAARSSPICPAATWNWTGPTTTTST